jgi:hypothetical protein
MPLESAVYLDTLDPTNPLGTDPIAFTDEHLRLIKAVLKATFPSIKGAVNLSQDQLNLVGTNLVPQGFIGMWSGTVAAIPTGWHLCDGTSGTPDLRDRFVVGAGGTYAVAAKGGSADATLPSHTHTATTGNASAKHTHGFSGTTDAVADHFHYTMVNAGSAPNNYNGVGATDSVPSMNHSDSGNWQYATPSGITAAANVGKSSAAGGHTHNITGATVAADGDAHTHAVTVTATGVSATGANLPPYYALAYIMKV